MARASVPLLISVRYQSRLERSSHPKSRRQSAPLRAFANACSVAVAASWLSGYRRLAAAGKAKVVVTTAIAREMVGFIWAIARILQPRPAIG
jgi:transposase